MDTAANLMLSGIAATCPDCGEERILVLVDEGEFCCTTCDAAVLLVDVPLAGEQLSRAAS